MKFCVLGDTHFGARNDLKLFHLHFEKFYDDLIADLVSQEITDLFQLGDLFDRRKYINFQSLKESKRYFFDRLEVAGITLHTLVGNHVTWHKQFIICHRFIKLVKITVPWNTTLRTILDRFCFAHTAGSTLQVLAVAFSLIDSP